VAAAKWIGGIRQHIVYGWVPYYELKREEHYMDEISYEGYLIEAAPYQLAESGEWAMQVNIWRDRGSHRNEKPFCAKNTFKTKEEAISHCLEFGKQILDGKVENCTVDDL
jgi:hypothetical protein